MWQLFFSLIMWLDAVGLGTGWNGLCSADHIFMSLKVQVAFAAPGQVGGFVYGRWKLTYITLIEYTILNI